jgi:hypothetical protein
MEARGKRKRFFFEKKNQKTFGTWAVFSGGAARGAVSVFWSFFQKKTAFLTPLWRLHAMVVLGE